MTTWGIINEIVSKGKIDEVYKILSDMVLAQKEMYSNQLSEKNACLSAIKKINNGKNKAIDNLCGND